MDLVLHKSIRIDMRWLGHQALAQPTPRRGATQRAHSAAVKVELLNRLPVGRYLQVRHLKTFWAGSRHRILPSRVLGHDLRISLRAFKSGQPVDQARPRLRGKPSRVGVRKLPHKGRQRRIRQAPMRA